MRWKIINQRGGNVNVPVRLNYSDVAWIDFGVSVVNEILVWLLEEQSFPEFYHWDPSFAHFRPKDEVLEFIDLEVFKIDWSHITMIKNL